MNKTTNLFLKLVQIDSPSGYEQKMSLFLQRWLKKNNFQFKIDKVGNIYAKNDKPGIPLLLCAHMDTVQPGIGIKPIIKNGIIESSGNTILGADNKAALSAILTAVENTKSNKALELLFTVKEETGGGVEYFPFEWIKSKQGLVFDSSKPPGGIILRSPYIYNFHVTITGKSAHSSLPNEGINALTPIINVLKQIPIGSLDNNETTINIGVINGGVGINTVPEKVNISGEVRSYNKKLFQKHLDNIKNIFEKESKKYGCKLDFNLDGYCSGYTHTKENKLIKQINVIYQNAGLKTVYHRFSGISDANILYEYGIQTLNLADGTKNPHCKDEQITVYDLEFLTNLIMACIEKL